MSTTPHQPNTTESPLTTTANPSISSQSSVRRRNSPPKALAPPLPMSSGQEGDNSSAPISVVNGDLTSLDSSSTANGEENRATMRETFCNLFFEKSKVLAYGQILSLFLVSVALCITALSSIFNICVLMTRKSPPHQIHHYSNVSVL